MKSQSSVSPFSLSDSLKPTPIHLINRGVATLLERACALKELERLYQRLPATATDREFLQHSFELLNVDYRIDKGTLQNIPQQGATVVVANHPYGGLDGMILAELLTQHRQDVKILANHFLQRVPELKDRFIPVNPFGGAQATRDNVASMKQALGWLKQGGLLVVFPSGEVSHFNHRGKMVMDQPWASTVTRLIRLSGADVTPVYFHGANSRVFQWAGMLHPLLRTAMLPRELLNKSQTTISLSIGETLSHQRLMQKGEDQQLAEYLRWRTYLLRNEPHSNSSATNGHQAEIIAPVASQQMIDEVAALPESALMAESGELQVYSAKAQQIPFILQEIGRLREVTFRATGEGTGHEIDLDLYDNYYLHLFIWNNKKQEVVGAYRMGLGDEIMAGYGIKGFYSYSLFNYSKKLIKELNPAIELGRSFVRQEYQRSFAPLMLLWKGIGGFVARNPRYRKLFGPVSISSDYLPASQQLMVDFLKESNHQPQLARHVKARNPFRAPSLSELAKTLLNSADLSAISELISEIEPDHKGVPILLKQYLKLGGSILEFNVDRQFNNAIDGLILVDLLETDAKVLGKYMGRESAQQFIAAHQLPAKEA